MCGLRRDHFTKGSLKETLKGTLNVSGPAFKGSDIESLDSLGCPGLQYPLIKEYRLLTGFLKGIYDILYIMLGILEPLSALLSARVRAEVEGLLRMQYFL